MFLLFKVVVDLMLLCNAHTIITILNYQAISLSLSLYLLPLDVA